MPMTMWGYYSAGYVWAAFIWMALNAAFWLAVMGVLVWALMRWLGRIPARGVAPPAPPASALDVLKQRYARGELDEPTLQRMREQLDAPAAREPVGASR